MAVGLLHDSYELMNFSIVCLFQAQSDDDDVGPDDVAVNVEGRDGFMDAFFAEVCTIYVFAVHD